MYCWDFGACVTARWTVVPHVMASHRPIAEPDWEVNPTAGAFHHRSTKRTNALDEGNALDAGNALDEGMNANLKNSMSSIGVWSPFHGPESQCVVRFAPLACLTPLSPTQVTAVFGRNCEFSVFGGRVVLNLDFFGLTRL